MKECLLCVFFFYQEEQNTDSLSSSKLKKKTQHDSKDGGEDTVEDETMDTEEGGRYDVPGERVATMMVARGEDSTIHTALEFLNLDAGVGGAVLGHYETSCEFAALRYNVIVNMLLLRH